MHDLDRTVMEYAAQPGAPAFGEYEEEAFSQEGFELEGYEFAGDHLEPHRAEAEGGLSEQEELELTMEALGVTNEEEFEYFLGNLINKIGKGIKSVAPGVLKTLGSAVRSVGKTLIPIAATAAGTFFGGPAGGALGATLGGALSKAMEAELEGLSQEEYEFEQARQFVRFAADTAQELEYMMSHGRYPHPRHRRRAVQHAMVRALRRRRIAPPMVLAPPPPPAPYYDVDGAPDGVYADGADDDGGEAEFVPRRARPHVPPHAHLRAPGPSRAAALPAAHTAAAGIAPRATHAPIAPHTPIAPIAPRAPLASAAPAAPIVRPHAPVPTRPITAHPGSTPSVPAPRPPVLPPRAPAPAPAPGARAAVPAGAIAAPQPPVPAPPAGQPMPPIPNFAPVRGRRGYWVKRGTSIYIYGA